MTIQSHKWFWNRTVTPECIDEWEWSRVNTMLHRIRVQTGYGKINFREHKSRNATNSWNQSDVEHNGGAPTAEVNSKNRWLRTTFCNDSANPNMLKNMDVTWLFPLITLQFRMSALMQKANRDWSENELFMCRPVWWKGSVMPGDTQEFSKFWGFTCHQRHYVACHNERLAFFTS